jgi:alkylation response protein AidB-like acyl-CoA dehydrogenase
MEFGFTQEQDLIRTQAAEFLKNECPLSLVRELMNDGRGFSDALWSKMAEVGWMGLAVSQDYGGEGLSFVELTVVLEEMGRHLVPGAYFSTAVLAGSVLTELASEEQKNRWLRPLANGDLRATLALTETSAVWSVSGVRLTAERRGRDFVLSGTKLFVPDAEVADLLLCVARTAGSWTPDQGVVVLAVDRESPGLTVTALNTMDQTRRLYEVSFDHVRVPADCLLGREDDATATIEKVIDKAAIGLCAEMAGGAAAVLEMSVDYSKSRTQFGRPIGSFQAIQHKCADMLLLVESSRSATYAAAWAASQQRAQLGLAASIAKAYTSDAYCKVAAEAIQIHGGMGFTWEHDVHLYFKRARADAVTFGDASFHRERIAGLAGLVAGGEGAAS